VMAMAGVRRGVVGPSTWHHPASTMKTPPQPPQDSWVLGSWPWGAQAVEVELVWSMRPRTLGEDFPEGSHTPGSPGRSTSGSHCTA
jgi:hypothetical protein